MRLACTQAGHELFGVGRESIDLTFGGVTIVTAVVATLLGGWALDRVGSSIKNAMLLNGENLHGMQRLHRSWTALPVRVSKQDLQSLVFCADMRLIERHASSHQSCRMILLHQLRMTFSDFVHPTRLVRSHSQI